MGLKEIYASLEEKYYNLMDKLDETGIPVYKVIDFFESKNIPTFPLFILLILVVLAGIIFLLVPAVTGTQTIDFTLNVTDGTNPVKGASIAYQSGKENLTLTTNSEGKAVLKVEEKEFTVIVTKNGFKKATKSFNAKKVKEGTVELEKAVLNPITVQLLGKGNDLLTEEITVSFTCSENSDWSETVTFYTGKTTLNDVPADCGKILAEPIGKDCDSSCDFDADSALIKIYLSEEITEKGKIFFTVMDEAGNYLQGIKVMAILQGNYSAEAYCNTFNGSCDIEIPFGTYYIRATDSSGEFKDYDSRDYTTTITINSSNQNKNFDEIILEKGVIGEIKIRVKDEEANPIENALVKLSKDSTEINQQRTNSSGEAVFNVAEVIDYTASVTHADYLNSDVKTLRPQTDFYEFVLKEATVNNTKGIIVLVVDEKGNPVENTKVFLKDIQGNVVGQEKVTGMEGKAVFERLEEGKYVIRAEKIGFEGKDSRVIEVKEKEPQEVTITLNIGQGILDVLVVDKEKQPIQSATIKVIDYFTGKEMFVDVTNTEGKKSFTIRADKKVYLEVTESTHAKYTSVPIQMFAGTEEKTISMEDSISAFGVKLEELSLQGMTVENDTLSEGQTYKAKFKLMIPKGTVSNNAGIHIRTGNDEKNQNNIMEKDDLYIKEITASNAKIIKGTTFNPNNGYSVDSMHLTTGNAKWANVKFSSVREGVYEIEAVIQVRETLNGSAMEIAFRGWVESGGIQRDPYDADLKEAVEISGVKQELYAEAKHKPLGIGASSLCEESFCYSFKVRDLQNATTTNIVDEFPAEISSNYEIEFSFINLNQKTYSNSELIVEATGIKLNSYEIEGITGEEEEISVETGNITEGKKISGKINFTTKDEGTDRIDFSLYGETANFGKEKILFKPLRAEVKNAKTMNIVTVPKNLVPFITNNLLVNITDETGKTVKDADIKIEKNSEFIGTGKTDSKGVFAYTFEPMNAGTIIKITAEKSGFNTAEKEMTVSKNIVDIIPSSISESFNAKIGGIITRDLVLKNTTEMPLTILSAELTDSFEGKIDAEIQGIGKEIIIANEEQLLVSLSLTEKGKNINELTSLKGEIIIVFENTEAGKQWTASIPLNITIGLGGEVDSTDCFNLSPTTWGIITGQEKKTTKLVLTNSCTVNGEAIALKDIKARIVWKENAIGSFDLSSDIEESTTQRLSNNYKVISENFNQHTGEEENLSLIFTPDEIENAAGTATIYIEAVNPTEKGEEKLKQKIEVTVNISELTSCIRIRPATSQLRIQMNYYNQGWGQTQNYFGYNPQYQMPYTMNPTYLNSTGMQFPFQNYPYDPNASIGSLRNNPNVVFPNSVYNQQWPSTYMNAPYTNPTAYNSSLNNAWNFNPTGKALIDVENTCPNPVQIEVEAAPELAVSDSTVVLTSGNHKEIEVTPSMFIGQYPLTIRAKHKDSTDAPKEIAKYNVLVESEAMRNYYDCISLSTRVFTFNGLIVKPVEGSVWNTCYDLGVILTQQSIPRDLSGTSTTNFNYPRDQGLSKEQKLESSGVIKSIEVIQLVNTPGINGKITQELKFRMRKNNEYYTLKDNKLPDSENPLIELANLRVRLTGLYYKVESEERLPITFYDRSGSQQIIPFDIIIEDLFALSEQDFIDFGNKDLSHQQCVIQDALDFTSKALENGTNQNGCFLNDIFVDRVSSGIDAQKVIVKKGDKKYHMDGKYCGDTDRIVGITNSVITDKSGIILHFGVEDGDKIKLVIDKRNAAYTPKEISGTLLARLSRVNPLETKTVSIPFKVCFEGGELTDQEKTCKNKVEEETKGISKEELILIIEQTINRLCPDLGETGKTRIQNEIIPETGEITACSDRGYTGTTAFTAYGFDKIKFDWSWDAITKTGCDTGETYCDATQLGIELARKAAEIKELGKQLDQSGCKGECKPQKAEEVYRFAVKKQEIVDNTVIRNLGGNDLVFFLDKDNSVIEGTKLDLGQGVKDKIQEMNDLIQGNLQANALNILGGNYMGEIIQDINNSGRAKDIIGEIETKDMNAASKNILTQLGDAQYAEQIGNTTKYLITFNEYIKFRDQLITCINADSAHNPSSCKIQKMIYPAGYSYPTPEYVIITPEFLRDFQNNITFKIGIRNIQNISEEDKQKVIEQGQLMLSLPDGKSLKEFYETEIEFTSYLKYDAATKDFREDFQDTYGSNASKVEFNDWEFQPKKDNKTFDSGTHKITFNFDWENPANTEITITKEADLPSKYQENYLFSVPFDGKVGAGSSTSRTLYGTGYGSDNSVNDIYLTESIALKKGNSNTGLKQFNSTTKPDSFASARNGTILSMTGETFTFTPSKPLGLKAELATGKTGVFYDLIKTGTEKIGIDQEKNLNYLFKWNSSADSKQSEGNLKTGTDCSDSRFGIIFGSNADKIQKALSFVPVNWAYVFQKHCNQGVTMTGYEFNFDSKGKLQVNATGLPGTAKFTSNVESNIEQKTSIEKWISDIKTENVCFTSSSTEFALEWNKEKLMNKMEN